MKDKAGLISLLKTSGGILMVLSLLMIVASHLQNVRDFETVVLLFIFICGACMLNYELFLLQRGKTHALALSSFVFGLMAFSIPGAPINAGVLTDFLAWLFSLVSFISGVSFLIMNKRRTGELKGNSAAITSVCITLPLLLLLFLNLFIPHPEEFYFRGKDYYYEGKYDLAIKEYSEAIRQFGDERFPDAHYERGLAYAKRGSFEDAISDYNKYIKSLFVEGDPNYVKAYLSRAEAYFYKHEYERSWDDVHRVEALGYAVNPDFISALKKASGK